MRKSIDNKWLQIRTAIEEHNIYIRLLTETWHTTSQDVALRRLTLPGYSRIDLPRLVRQHEALRRCDCHHQWYEV